MKVVRNTYPVYPGVTHGEPGDVVEWGSGRGKFHLERESDGKSIFSRDCLPRDVDDNRPMVGIIAQVKSRGWVLEIKPNSGSDGEACDQGKGEAKGGDE